MKTIWTILLIGFAFGLQGQHLHGTIKFNQSEYIYSEFVWVTAKNLDRFSKDNYLSVRSDSSGQFRLDVNPNELYRISIEGLLAPDTTFNIKLAQDSTVNLIINYPPKICPYEKAKESGICPEGNHRDNVIQILYGLLEGTEILDKVKKNEIIMGGCEVSGCDPNWYCKTHDRKF